MPACDCRRASVFFYQVGLYKQTSFSHQKANSSIMRIIILLSLIHSISLSFGQENLEKIIRNDKSSKIKEIYYLDNSDKKQGEYQYKYKNHLQVFGHYKDDKKNGIWIYTPSKDFSILGEFYNDMKSNKWICIEKKDTLSILNYNNNKPIGLQLGFFSNGQLGRKRNYNDSGLLHGEFIEYYTNGNIKELMHFVNGVKHGDYLFYSENGNLITKLTYFENIPINLENFTNDTSLILYSGDLKNGNGSLTEFSIINETNNKHICLTRNYKDRLLHGEIVGYNYDGKISFKGYYFKGYMDGKWKFYNSKGKIDKEKTYSYSNGLTEDSTEYQTMNYEAKFTVIQRAPRFYNNDIQGFIDFISQNLQYPSECIINRIEGSVDVQFTVNALGQVVDAKVNRSSHPLLDREALRVINLSPMWIPGLQFGTPVNVEITYPVVFKLP